MVYLGADHGGFDLKEHIKKWLTEWNIPFEDCGPYTLDPDDDYPDYAKKVSEKVGVSKEAKGILICRSGGGMVIAANKKKGVRAVFVFDERSVAHAREQNDANVISLASDWTKTEDAKNLVHLFLTTPFSGIERHARRVEKLNAM